MAGRRVHFVFPAELVDRVDAALLGESRGEFVRRAVERALADVEGSVRVEADAPRMGDGRDVDSRPAPAEQPEQPERRASAIVRDPDAGWGRGANATPPSREFRPYPKGGKR